MVKLNVIELENLNTKGGNQLFVLDVVTTRYLTLLFKRHGKMESGQKV